MKPLSWSVLMFLVGMVGHAADPVPVQTIIGLRS